MANTSKSGSEKYQTRLSGKDADRIEEFREKEGLNKSEAVRELLRAGSVEQDRVERFRDMEGLTRRDAVQLLVRSGLDEKNRRARLYERATEGALAVLFAAGLLVAVATLVGVLGAVFGELTGVSALSIVAAGLGTLGLLALAAGLGWYLFRAGVMETVDQKVESLRRALGIDP